jgi:hypothetical protein
MPKPPPYQSLQHVQKLHSEGKFDALQELHDSYMDYFAENQCEPINGVEGWSGLGEYFLDLARKGSHGLTQTREEFSAATQGKLKQPVPAWIQTITYVQTDLEGTYYLALPPKVLAEQAYIHARNPKTATDSYVKPPIYSGFAPDIDPVELLNTRICDYVISHCG